MSKGNEELRTRTHIENIIDLLLTDKEQLSEHEAGIIRQWLVDPKNSVVKSDAFVRKLSEAMRASDNPRLGLETWPEVARRIGVDPDIIFGKGKATPLRPARKSVPLWRRAAVRVAAVVLPVAVALGVWALYDTVGRPQSEVAQEITVSVPVNETKEITLPDGSTVTLFDGSEIAYEQDFKGGRSVELAGHAVFNVVKVIGDDGERTPFTVSTDNMKVNVLGTVFRMEERGATDKSTVALYEGSVSVENGGTAELRRGEQFTYDKITKEHTVTLLPAREMLDNGHMPVMRFDGSNLSELILAMESNYGVRFILPRGVDLQSGGISADFEGFALEDIVSVLSAMDKKYAYRLGGNTITITNKKIILDD